MKRRIMLQALETAQKRIEDAKESSEADPYVDAYAMQKTLLHELIDLLKSNSDAMCDVQLIHWIDRQQHVGYPTAIKLQTKKDIHDLNSILEKERTTEQMSIYDLPEVYDEETNKK